MASVLRTGRLVEVQPGIRLHCAEAGTPGAPLIVFLHGFPEFWGTWKDILPRFAQNWFAVAPDMRGYNLSSKPTELADYRIEPLVADIEGLVTALGYQDCVLVAHDWGGAVGWAVAISKPQRVRRLVILNAPHPVPFARLLASDPDQQKASTYMAFLRSEGSEAQLCANGFAMLESFLFAGAAAPHWYDQATREAYHAAWGQPGAIKGGVNYYRATALRSGAAKPLNLDPRAFMVNMPTRVIWGERDRALLPALLTGLDEVVPDLEIVKLPKASHWLTHEEPDRVASLIHEFASR
ncbi:MAG: alpha/beta fold hydrolase [Burkholderiaceae bacterium]